MKLPIFRKQELNTDTIAAEEKNESAAVENTETDELDARLDAALEGDENVDLKALVFDLFDTVDAVKRENEADTDDKDQNRTGSVLRKPLDFKVPSLRSIIITDLVALLAVVLCVALTKPPEETEGIRVTQSSYNSISIEWEPVEDADGYRVYRSRDGRDYEYIGSSAHARYKDNTVKTGCTYSYKISARNGLKSSDIESADSVEAVPQLETPELDVTTDNGSIELSYTPVDGATGYSIIRDGEEVGNLTSEETTFTDDQAEGNTDYSYEVKAYRYKKEPVFSESSNAVETRLDTVGHIDVETKGEDLLLSWEPAEQYTSFEIYSDGELLEKTSDTAYRIEGLEADKEYDISIIGYADDEEAKSPEEERRFTVEEVPMDNQGAIDAACDWGVSIAEDDSFTYGTGRRAHRTGCYFCGTNVGPNLNRKGSSKVGGHSYAKTYCCNPFVHACFAHGAGDPAMLNACQHGKSVGMKESSYTRYGNWKKVGKPAYSNLKRGDVLVKHSHVCLYIGDGQIVHAGTEGWDADSITVKDLSAKAYGGYSFVMRYTGNGGGTMYAVKDIEETDQADAAESEEAAPEQSSEQTQSETSDKAESTDKNE